jgi:hypothetical protein
VEIVTLARIDPIPPLQGGLAKIDEIMRFRAWAGSLVASEIRAVLKGWDTK